MPGASPHESLEWVNNILLGTWPYASRFVERTLREEIQPMVNSQLPGPLALFSFGEKVTLGDNPLRVERIDTQSSSPDAVKLEVDIVYDGDAEIECSCAGVPFGVKHISVRGRLALLMRPLIKTIPLVGAVQLAFYSAPQISLDFTGAASIADISLVESTITSCVGSVLSSMMVLPNKFLVKLDPATNFLSVFVEPEGLLRLGVAEAKGLQAKAALGGLVKRSTDPYVVTTLGAVAQWTTATQSGSDPAFGEKRDFVLHDLDQELLFTVSDSDIGFDSKLGSIVVTARSLLKQHDGDAWLNLLDDDGSETGAQLHLTGQLFNLTSLDADLSKAAESQTAAVSDKDLAARSCAVLTMIVNFGRGLPEASAPAVVLKHGDQKFKTNEAIEAVGVDLRNPLWEKQFEMLLDPEALDDEIVMELVDGDKTIGEPWSVTIGTIRTQEGMSYTVDAEMGGAAVVQARFILHACVEAS